MIAGSYSYREDPDLSGANEMPLKLWKAILVGCDKRAQAFGDYFQERGETRISCALGAAYESTFEETPLSWNGTITPNLLLKFPQLQKTANCPISDCPMVSVYEHTLFGIITHLNDDHRWPREKIALEFVKPIEEALEEAYDHTPQIP